MKSIKKKNNSFFMIGSFLILLVVFLLLLSKKTMSVTNETIELRDTVALMKALEEDINISEQIDMIYEKNTSDEGSIPTTYKMLEEIFDVLNLDEDLSVQFLDNVSKEKEVDRETFFKLYDSLIIKIGKQNEIFLEDVDILGVVSEKEGKATIITKKEKGYCDSSCFSDSIGFTTQTYLKRNGEETIYIAVKEKKDDKIELPYLYIKGQDFEGIHFQMHDENISIPCESKINVSNDVVASLSVREGKVVDIEIYDEKINGKVLAVNETFVTLENKGKIEFAEGAKIYKVFDSLAEGNIADVALGYEFVDFVMDKGKICACLIVANDEMEYIRVLLKTTDFLSNYHANIVLSCDSDFKVYLNGEEQSFYKANEEVTFDDKDFDKEDMIKIVPEVLSAEITIKSIVRNQGNPSYKGIMELHKKEEGFVLINELLLEEYLYTVVPSEMPSYYPEQALMAQSICARTYAYTKMLNAGLKDLGAHLDDSTSFQVYNNIDKQVSTTNAVRKTNGLVVWDDSKAVETLYYSTSCGLSAGGMQLNKEKTGSIDVSSNENFEQYILYSNASDYESDEAFYRWSYETILDTDLLEKRLKECYNKNKNNILYLDSNGDFVKTEEFKETGSVTDIFVAQRSNGGRAEKIVIKGRENTVMVCGEYQIRYSLLNEEKIICKQDNTVTKMSTLLPSAFFIIETGQSNGSVVGYSIVGGGYGHGNGMSQNGAGNMARHGYTYETILKVFYDNCTIEQIY